MRSSVLLISVLLILIVIVLYLITNTNKELWVENNPIIKSENTCHGPAGESNPSKLVDDCCNNANVDAEADSRVKTLQIKACKKCLKKGNKWFNAKEAHFSGKGICFRNGNPIGWKDL